MFTAYTFNPGDVILVTNGTVEDTFTFEGGTSGEIGGYQYVDLDLPSETKWATMNVGASSETDYGNYYQYGNGATKATKDNSDYSGIEDPLDSSVDTAVQVWGGSWHMPTKTQFEELIANTTYQWVTNYKSSGINGATFTATNGAVLFLPATGNWGGDGIYDVGDKGCYWSSSPTNNYNAYYSLFDDDSESVYSTFRTYGFSVRPVVG